MDIRVGSRQGGRGNGFRGGAPFKKRQYLTGDFARDMLSLRIKGRIRSPQTRKETMVDETPRFITYLTLALQNVSDILGKGQDLSNMKEESAVRRMLAESGKMFEVASFLWMHRVDEPGRDYDRIKKGEYAERAEEIVVTLWKLRNMFVHPAKAGAAMALVVTPSFFRFVEGELYSKAREHALGPGRKSEKIFKLKLFNPHDDNKLTYEFTRKGMIFLVCLALYRHDASEFIQQFPDLQLPPREWQIEQGVRERPDEAQLVALRKKGGSVKAILDAFTWYSMRASRTDIDVDNSDYLNFANILLYLNKVPSAAYNYLSLEDEAKRLTQKAAESKESEENKRFKYLLQERKKDRFLTLALAYLEDFSKLDCVQFKRLDITVHPGRKRYMFGRIKEGDVNECGEPICDANGMDRHYAIHDGAAQFEFVPEQHYGPIEIKHLRGSISEGEVMRLLLVMFDNGIRRTNPNDAIKEYLTAYHRILERMLNAGDASEFSLDDPQYRLDFKTVSGRGDDVFTKDKFVEAMKPFFSENITRYFVGDELRPAPEALQQKLLRRFKAMQARAEDFLLKMDKLTDWRELDEEARKSKGFPVCAIGELKFPPRTCKVNDAHLVKWVLRYINLFLSNEEKYRQLPRGMRHRGAKDFEFQLLHTDIGRFGVNPQGLWRTLEKRSSINGEDGALEMLKERERELFSSEQKRCRGKRDKNGKPLRVGHTLTMLATAAAELYCDRCQSCYDTWSSVLSEEDKELLPYECPRYGVRAGMPLDHGALVKTVLGIDLDSWAHAYDYETKSNFEGRQLSDSKNDLIVTQVPMPNVFAMRCVKPGEDGNPFKFNPEFRAFMPYEQGKMALRRYYDATPLIAAVKRLDAGANFKKGDEETHKRANAEVLCAGLEGVETRMWTDVCDAGFGKEPPRSRPSFARGDVNKAIQAILLAERQDKVLLACAKAYWDRYMGEEVTAVQNETGKAVLQKKNKIKNIHLADAADIGEFFSIPIDDMVNGVKIRMMPNDFARPAYGVVTAHVKELVYGTEPLPGTDCVYSFYDLWLTLRKLQRDENSIRLEFLPAAVKFNAYVDVPPELEALPNNDPEKLPKTLSHCNKALSKTGDVKPLTEEEYLLLADFETRLRHPAKNGLGLVHFDTNTVCAIYKRFGFMR